MKKYIVFKKEFWEADTIDLTEGKKYYVMGSSFQDDVNDHRILSFWNGDIYIEVEGTEEEQKIDLIEAKEIDKNLYLYKVCYRNGFGETSLFVFADSRRAAVAKSLEKIGKGFDSIECSKIVNKKDILYAD